MLATAGIAAADGALGDAGAAADGALGDAAAGGSLFGERIQEKRLDISQLNVVKCCCCGGELLTIVVCLQVVSHKFEETMGREKSFLHRGGGSLRWESQEMKNAQYFVQDFNDGQKYSAKIQNIIRQKRLLRLWALCFYVLCRFRILGLLHYSAAFFTPMPCTSIKLTFLFLVSRASPTRAKRFWRVSKALQHVSLI
jgi:hypothetical protein